MKKLAPIAAAALLAVTGAVSPAFAAPIARDPAVWQTNPLLIAVRGGGGRNEADKGGRNDGGHANHGKAHDKRGGKVIWRVRGKHQHPFFLFRLRDSGPDCFTRRMQVQDQNGNVKTKSIHMCD